MCVCVCIRKETEAQFEEVRTARRETFIKCFRKVVGSGRIAIQDLLEETKEFFLVRLTASPETSPDDLLIL